MILSDNNFFKNHNWKNLSRKLILENCLIFGLNPRLTSKKVTKYLFGTRATLEIFKLYELRYLLLKIYPLIHILFHNPRVNPRLEIKQPKIQSLNLKQEFFAEKTMFSFKQKNLPPQILFATTTETFSDIILQAAKICNMPHHTKRWINGSITAAISDIYSKNAWEYKKNLTSQKISYYFTQNWHQNKENNEKIKEKNQYFGRSRWPSLIAIPDISNNKMILSEIAKIGIPVIGLVNSNCPFEINYPIFAQDQTTSSVYFFCHFLSTLIAKEIAYSRHKHYALQKIQNLKKTKETDHFKKVFERKQMLMDFEHFFMTKRALRIRKKFAALKKKRFFSDIYSSKKSKKLTAEKPKKLTAEERKKKQIADSEQRKAFWQSFNVKQKKAKKKGIFFDIKKETDEVHKNISRHLQQIRRQNSDLIKRNHIRKKSNLINRINRSNIRKKSKKSHKSNRSKLMKYKLGLFFKFYELDDFKPSKDIKNLWKYWGSRFEKKKLAPTIHMMFKKETAKKHFLLNSEKTYMKKKPWARFLWNLKKWPSYWKYKIFTKQSFLYQNNSYYWLSLRTLASDFRWYSYKYKCPKFLRIPRPNESSYNALLWKKKKKKYKRLRQKNTDLSSKRPWHKWVSKNTTHLRKNYHEKNIQK